MIVEEEESNGLESNQEKEKSGFINDTTSAGNNLSLSLKSRNSSMNSTKGGEKVYPSLDERLQAVLHNKIALHAFHEYCYEGYSLENLLCWLDIEIFHTAPTSMRRSIATVIYLTYLAPDSPHEINLSAEMRAEIPWPLGETIDPCMFDDAQEVVYTLIKSDAFIRFEKSTKYERLLEIRKAGTSWINFSFWIVFCCI